MRIVAGAWRGRSLITPAGNVTRPTAEVGRQALFDMLAHAPWAPPDGVRGMVVLDAFAGTGALGLEALSRGAAQATFMERDPTALAALRTNIQACRADDVAILEADAFRPPRAPTPATLVFLDPPYGADAPARVLSPLRHAGWIAPDALLVVETERAKTLSIAATLLAERTHGIARISVFRELRPGAPRL